jgi:hypothetical protein
MEPLTALGSENESDATCAYPCYFNKSIKAVARLLYWLERKYEWYKDRYT